MELSVERKKQDSIKEYHIAYLLNQLTKKEKENERLLNENLILQDQLSKVKVNGYLYEDIFGLLSVFVPHDRIYTVLELGYKMYKDKIYDVCAEDDGRFKKLHALCKVVNLYSFFYHNYSQITGECVSRKFYEGCLARVFRKDEKRVRSGMNNARLKLPVGVFAEYTSSLSNLSVYTNER